MIDFTGICKSYGKQDIFDNVSFRINPGERVEITYYRDGKTYSATATLQNSKGTTELRVR